MNYTEFKKQYIATHVRPIVFASAAPKGFRKMSDGEFEFMIRQEFEKIKGGNNGN